MRLFRTLILSLALHLLLVWGLLQIPETKFSLPRPPTVVELLESPETPKEKKDESVWKAEKQFVRSAPPPPEELTKEKKKDPRFSSEEDQYVLEERQAHNSGLTANRSPESRKEEPHQPHDQQRESRQRPANKRKTLDLMPDSPLERGATAEITEDAQEPTETDRAADGSRPLDLPGFEAGQSTVGEALPSDIQFGDFTALNTDRHRYYTFYARIEEMIRHRWVTYARAVLAPYQNGARRLTGNETWVTRLEILLDPQGRFIKAILHNGSGIQELDSAPVQAFRDARQFPNPPPEMVKDDGSIHVYYQFHVQVVPRYAKGASDTDEE